MEDRIDQGVKVHDIARVLQFVLVLDDLRNKILQGLEEKRWHPLLLISDGKVLFEHFFQIISAWLSNNISYSREEILRMETFNGFFFVDSYVLLLLKWCCLLEKYWFFWVSVSVFYWYGILYGFLKILKFDFSKNLWNWILILYSVKKTFPIEWPNLNLI